MDERSSRALLQKHTRAGSSPPFYSVGATKTHIVTYLRQYRHHQWLAASRGLIPKTAPNTFDAPGREEFAPGRLEEDNELVLARLRTTQSSIQTSISDLDGDLARLETTLLSTRSKGWIRTGVVTLLVSAFLTLLFASHRRGHLQFLGVIPRNVHPFIPLIPSPIAIFLIAIRERRISAVEAARARIKDLRVTVASSEAVSLDEISWIGSEKWDGVDWSLIGL